MNKILLITRPNHDETTFYCSEWAQEIVEFAEERGFQIKDMITDSNKKNVENFLKKKNPRLVFFYGHGSDDTVCGHKDEVLIKSNENDHLLKKKIIHSLSCSSAKRLGPNSVKKGAEAFIGYENKFAFFSSRHKSAHPTRDEVAKPFFLSANEAPIALLKGKTVEEAVRKTQIAYSHWITYYRLHDELLEATQNLIGLIWNKANLIFHGDSEAKV